MLYMLAREGPASGPQAPPLSAENGGDVVDDEKSIYIASEDEVAKIHWLQRLFDNPWLLLVLGISVPLLSYTAWGWIELLLTKKAELP